MVLKMEFEEELERKFRELAMKRYGYSKGSIKKAGEEAIKSWIDEEEELPSEEDPIRSIRGILKHVKKTSVELQHEAWEGIIKKHAHRH